MISPFVADNIRFEFKSGGDQICGPGEEAVTFDNPDVGAGYLCPDADSTKDYFVLYSIVAQRATSSGAFPYRVRVGAAGTVADAEIWRGGVPQLANNNRAHVFMARIVAPGASDVVTLTLETVTNIQTVRGGTTPAIYSSLQIWEDG